MKATGLRRQCARERQDEIRDIALRDVESLRKQLNDTQGVRVRAEKEVEDIKTMIRNLAKTRDSDIKKEKEERAILEGELRALRQFKAEHDNRAGEEARLRAEQERKAAEEAAARLHAERERKQSEEQEAARIRAEQERKASEDAAARLNAERERKQREEQEAARIRAEQERRAAEETAARLNAERERKQSEEQEAARIRVEQERKAAEEARLKADEDEKPKVVVQPLKQENKERVMMQSTGVYASLISKLNQSKSKEFDEQFPKIMDANKQEWLAICKELFLYLDLKATEDETVRKRKINKLKMIAVYIRGKKLDTLSRADALALKNQFTLYFAQSGEKSFLDLLNALDKYIDDLKAKVDDLKAKELEQTNIKKEEDQKARRLSLQQAMQKHAADRAEEQKEVIASRTPVQKPAAQVDQNNQLLMGSNDEGSEGTYSDWDSGSADSRNRSRSNSTVSQSPSGTVTPSRNQLQPPPAPPAPKSLLMQRSASERSIPKPTPKK